MMFRKYALKVSAIAGVALLAGALIISPAAAQGGGDRGGRGGMMGDPRGGRMFGGALPSVITACSSTDYTAVAATALSMTAEELRVALSSGQNLLEIASSKNVEVTTLLEALNTARTADIDQALKDGLITEAQATALKNMLSGQMMQPGQGNQPPAVGTPQAGQPGQRGRGDQPRIFIFRGRGNAAFAGISGRNTVKPYVVAGSALGMTCVDVVKGAQAGKSIAELAAEKGVALQTVVDALTKAYTDALDKDVAEGLIAKVRADAARADIVNTVLRLISQDNVGRGGIQLRMSGIPNALGQNVEVFGADTLMFSELGDMFSFELPFGEDVIELSEVPLN
ncbi:MAG: hypothetical protein OHK0023_27900 [Anaerolineae bacterium]